MIEVLLVDDDLLMRAGLRMIIEQAPDLVVSGEAADGQQAVAAARRARPHPGRGRGLRERPDGR